MWFKNSIFYHIYPLGFYGAPDFPDNQIINRLQKTKEWITHLKSLNITSVYFGPVFDSDKHGYDTRDYQKIDPRLGTNENFAEVCQCLHAENIKIILDGVFHHVGRSFWAFQDIIKNQRNSSYIDWFFIDFNQNSNYNDGFWYEGWEGHYDLVKLNLGNPKVISHLLDSVKLWIDLFQIDGLRLDVAYSLDQNFIGKLCTFTKEINPAFFLLGEIIHGDYNQLMSPGLLDSCTNYECYKGLYSSFNDLNMFEIAYSLNRQFGEQGIYKGKSLAIFADNHDVNRLASVLKQPEHLPLLYTLMFTMPGIPFLYYGSEWGTTGIKQNGDDSGLRPCFDHPIENDLTAVISKLALIHQTENALYQGSYKQIYLTNEQFIFKREWEHESIYIIINAGNTDLAIPNVFSANQVVNLMTGEIQQINHELFINKYSFFLLKN